jgi:hypothetical protein
MQTNIRELKQSEISSEVFIISPTQIDIISKMFADAVAQEMNVRPLSEKIHQIAKENLLKTLKFAKRIGE